LRPELVADPAFAERFEREARALALLHHPGIVGVHDFGRARAFFYLVMEYVDGASLRELLAQGRLTTRDVLAFVPQLCDALQYAHDHRVVHRDIKPENVLVGEDGRVRVADFGLAKLLGQDRALGITETQQAVGTPLYMAPEQVTAAGSVDHRADLYSLGVVLYEMLTGKLPIGRFAPPSAAAVDARGFDPVVMRSLENDPARRYQQAHEVRRDIEAAGAGSEPGGAATAPGRSPLARRPGNPLRSNPRWVAWHFGVVVGVASLLALGQFWLAGSLYAVFLGLSYFALPAEYRRPEPGAPQVVPWTLWLGAALVLVAFFLDWGHVTRPMAGTAGNVVQHVDVWRSTRIGVPIWLLLVVTFFVFLLGTIRTQGVAIPRHSLLWLTGVGLGFTGLVLLRTSTQAGGEVGIGNVVVLLVYLFWASFELRFGRETAQEAARQRRERRELRRHGDANGSGGLDGR